MKKALFIASVIYFASCQARPRFNAWEQAWMDAHNEGDTLYLDPVAAFWTRALL